MGDRDSLFEDDADRDSLFEDEVEALSLGSARDAAAEQRAFFASLLELSPRDARDAAAGRSESQAGGRAEIVEFPPESRAALYEHLLCADGFIACSPESEQPYDALLRQKVGCTTIAQIDADVLRTAFGALPTGPATESSGAEGCVQPPAAAAAAATEEEEGGADSSPESTLASQRAALRRVLRAFAAHNPDVGYCQGLNSVAARLLQWLPEPSAFSCLSSMVGLLVPRDYYSAASSMAGILVDQQVRDSG
jgi:hypothetical protein